MTTTWPSSPHRAIVSLIQVQLLDMSLGSLLRTSSRVTLGLAAGMTCVLTLVNAKWYVIGPELEGQEWASMRP